MGYGGRTQAPPLRHADQNPQNGTSFILLRNKYISVFTK